MSKEVRQLSEKDDKATIDEWMAQARQVKSPQELAEFVRHLMYDYQHDYGTVVYAVTAAGLAGMWAANAQPNGGITGFQAGCVFWTFYRHWLECGEWKPAQLLKFDNMLYPQYERHFDKVIEPETWKWLQEQAAEKLKSKDGHSEVRAHWQSIVDGKVPFGYTVKEDDCRG